MPWRGPVEGSDLLEDQFPSLGWALADELDEIFPWMPCTNEQVRKLVEFYRIDPIRNRRAIRRGQFMGPKGVGKSPEAAKFAVAELCLDVVFDGWDADGDPVGRPWVKPTPLVQIAAVSLDQTDNTYGALLELLSEDDGAAADLLGLDVGDTRTLRRDNHRARIDKVTASAGAREGQPVVFAVKDETHLWLPTNGGRTLSRTINRNTAKMDGSTLETTNAYDPALNSVAQITDERVTKHHPEGVYQWKPQARHVKSLRNRRSVRAALRKVYVDADWVNLDRQLDEIDDPETTEADYRRFFLNEVWAGSDAAWEAPQWAALRHPDGLVLPPDKDQIAVGFDGSRFNDSTALVGVRLEDRHEFLIEAWERPPDVEDDDWEVSEAEVDAAMERAFDTWRVSLGYCDPPYWQDVVDRWDGQYGVIRKWWTNRPRPMAEAIQAFNRSLRPGVMSHDGNPVLTSHHLNAQKRTLTIRDDKGKFLWVVEKKSPKSPLKIDARVAGILAHTAASDAVAKGALKRRRRRKAAFV